MSEELRELIETKIEVRNILEEDQGSRNSDLRLVLKFWEKQGIDVSRLLTLTAFMTTPESITRVRRDIQNYEGDLLPTDPEILIRRRIKEDIIRKFYGSGNRTLLEWQNKKYGIN